MQVGCEKDIAQSPRCHAVYCDAFGDIDFFFTTLYPSLFRLLTLLVLPSFSQTLPWSEMLCSFIETCFIFLLLCVCFAVAVSCFHSNIFTLHHHLMPRPSFNSYDIGLRHREEKRDPRWAGRVLHPCIMLSRCFNFLLL